MASVASARFDARRAADTASYEAFEALKPGSKRTAHSLLDILAAVSGEE